MGQSALIEQLFAKIKALEKRMLVLEKENASLREKLSKYENPKKISGQFKSMTGAMNFAILRSITDSAIKNGQNVLKALFTIATLRVENGTTD